MAYTRNYYGYGATNGSSAYDLSNPELYPDYTYETPLERPAEPTVKEAVSARQAVQSKQSLAPFALLGFGLAAVLLVFSLMAQIQLAQISDDTVKLQSKLSEMKLAETRLLISYESAFNLTEIERYAINVLGMQKPRVDQLFYIEGESPDKTIIHSEKTEDYGLLDRFADMLSSLGEYFR